MKKFFALLVARNKEYVRDRGSMAWGLLFPFLIILGFSFAFSGKDQDIFKAVVLTNGSAAAQVRESDFLKTKFIQFIESDSLESSLGKLKRHQVDILISGDPSPKYWINSSSPKGYILEKMIIGQKTPSGETFHKEEVHGKEIRYVDWLMSGLLSMNIMFSSLFGVGYVIVRYRKAGVLRRMKATPVSAFEFLAAQVASRFLLIIATSVIVLVGCHFLVGVQMVGSYAHLFVVLATGALCLISLALVIASRVASEEFAGGLLNLLTWPMMLFSGVWFSLEGTNPLLQKVAQIFPLTHMVDASRAIMTEGAGLMEISGHLAVLGVLTLIFMTAGSWLFKWE
ncbi:MAG: hypothetical protein RIR26_918 [Pseudomonadota bacterium]